MKKNVTNKDMLLMYKIVVMGSINSEKNKFIQQYVGKCDQLSKPKLPTLGIDFVAKEIKANDFKCCFQIWNTSGQESYRTLSSIFLKDTFIFILLFNRNDQESFEYSKRQFIELQNKKYNNIILVGNQNGEVGTQLKKEEVDLFVSKNNLKYFEINVRDFKISETTHPINSFLISSAIRDKERRAQSLLSFAMHCKFGDMQRTLGVFGKDLVGKVAEYVGTKGVSADDFNNKACNMYEQLTLKK